jgi:predicted membrane channel-forming protein YqfA (hemolysin III family)
MKYARHPEKFSNPDPILQHQWLDLKEVLCDNEFMVGYKIMIGQPVTLASVWNVMTTAHTDTSNIWSHIFGMVWLACVGFKSPFPVCLAAFAPSLCYFLSSVYHIFRNYSRRLFDICLCLDVMAIAIQISGFFVTGSYLFFRKTQPRLAENYVIGAFCLLLVTVIAIPFILKWKLYWLRTLVLACETVVCVPLVIHKYCLDGMDEVSVRYLILQGMCLAFGGAGIAVRSAHIPERFFPRTILQYIFHSHFWFHILTVCSSRWGVAAVAALE